MSRTLALTLALLACSPSTESVTDAGADASADVTSEDAMSEGATSSDVASEAPLAGSYATSFPLAENPISEGSRWIGGLTTGVDWHDVRTTAALAFGTQDGTTTYDDSIAILAGAWGSTQTAQATAHVSNANDGGQFEEIELLLRFSIVAHSAQGYEINCSIKPNGIGGGPYMQIVKWLGARNAFFEIDGRNVGCADGDVLGATVTGSGNGNVTIAASKNGVVQFSVVDDKAGGIDAYDGGAPGVGFYLQNGATADDADYGFSEYSVQTN